MKSEDIALLEFLANIGLIAGLNKRLADANMDGPATSAMAIGGMLGMWLDVLILNDMAKKQDPDAPIGSYVSGSDALAGFLLITLCMFAAVATRHVVPAAAKSSPCLIFNKFRSARASTFDSEAGLDEALITQYSSLQPSSV